VPPIAIPGHHAKKKTLIARERDEAQRTAWRAAMAEIDPTDLLFLDETHTPTTMIRTYGRAPRNERAIGRVRTQKWETITFVGTLTSTGLGAAALCVPGALDQAVFDAFVDQQLVPTLRPGQIVVLDNLRVHRSPHARDAIEAARCSLHFLPPYSPDFNPIEFAFAKMKGVLRTAHAQTYDAMLDATAVAMTQITAGDAAGFFRAAGFPLR
jgi:hypothetical protein